MSAVNHFKEQSKSDNFNGFIIEFSQLKNNFKALIASHYSFDIFKSIRSKTEFIAPDLLPFKYSIGGKRKLLATKARFS